MNTNLLRKLTAAACLGVGSAGLCAVANAATDPVPTQVVRYADLNISSPDGARILYGRIQAAARLVCQFELTSFRHWSGREQACFKHAVDDAVRQVHSPALSQIHGILAPRFASR